MYMKGAGECIKELVGCKDITSRTQRCAGQSASHLACR